MHPLTALMQSCVRGYTLSLLLAFWKGLGRSKLIPKGLGTLVPDPVALSRPCCGKTRQSKRLLSILIVQSRISGNLLSCLFIYLTHILGFWVTCGVKMMSLCHGWGWQPPQTASCIHPEHIQIQSVWAHWVAVHRHSSRPTQLYIYFLDQNVGNWVTCGVNMMSFHHGWGWQPPETASCFHIRHVQSVWEHRYAVHRHLVAALELSFSCGMPKLIVKLLFAYFKM